jgi:purine-nucleoside phosphorylase
MSAESKPATGVKPHTRELYEPVQASEFAQAEEAARYIRARLAEGTQASMPEIAVVLGSGLGDFADDLRDSISIRYDAIPYFPPPTAAGHAGRLVIGKLGDVTLALMQGRVHQYEGYTSRQVAFPVRVLGRLGIRALVLTNAAGGINNAYGKGALVLLSDHINLQGTNPLAGPNDERFGPRFPDMTEAYSARLRSIAFSEASRLGIALYEGVYAAVAGPNYETPAEIRYLRAIGADLVGMSTVPEVIVARHMGIEVLAISCVTNMAAGHGAGTISHEEVLETGAHVRGTLLSLIAAVLPKISEQMQGKMKR